MTGRRAVGMAVAGLAVGLLLAVRAARAQEPEPVTVLPTPELPKPAVAGRTLDPAVPAPRRASSRGYAPEAAASSSRLAPDERTARALLRVISLASQVESEASRIAITRGHSPGVRSFAIDLLQAHQAAAPELLRLLHDREMAPPLMDIAQRKALQRLARASGPKFDREYLELVSPRSGRDEADLSERALPMLTDPVLRSWVERQLPILREQHAAADRLLASRRTDAVARR